MKSSLEDEVQRMVASMESEEPNEKEKATPGTTEQEIEPSETIHIHYFPDAIVIVKEDGDKAQPDNTVETTLVKTKRPPVFIAYAVCLFYLLLIFSCIGFQIYEILNPPIATVTVVPRSQTVTLSGTLQLGRLLNPITISQSQIAPTTGKGHQDARSATGFITFYNGQLSSVTVPAGTLFIGNRGEQIATDTDAHIPPESQTIPPTLGQATVSAHAVTPGSNGNIPTGDINQRCCAPSILVQNTAFTGGQDARDFKIVTIEDITTASTLLKTTLSGSMQAALQAQLKTNEALVTPSCTTTVSPDHRPGQEATQVKVTASETCSGIAYNTQQLESTATTLLTAKAIHTLGTGYSLLGEVHTTITHATTKKQFVALSFSATSTWAYALTSQDQQHLKKIIAGKTKQEATVLLQSIPGIEKATITWEGKYKLPTDTRNIHIVIFVV